MSVFVEFYNILREEGYYTFYISLPESGLPVFPLPDIFAPSDEFYWDPYLTERADPKQPGNVWWAMDERYGINVNLGAEGVQIEGEFFSMDELSTQLRKLHSLNKARVSLTTSGDAKFGDLYEVIKMCFEAFIDVLYQAHPAYSLEL